MLTDMYQVTMAYAYWYFLRLPCGQSGRHEIPAVFDLYFRINPFGGEFAIFAGLSEVLKFLSTYEIRPTDISYLKTILPNCNPLFFDWFSKLSTKDITVASNFSFRFTQ